jgi:wobble nucleotide-excising tRNase
MRPKLQNFVKHNFVAKWQDSEFKTCIKSFPENSVVSVVDFAENYSFEIQNEV